MAASDETATVDTENMELQEEGVSDAANDTDENDSVSGDDDNEQDLLNKAESLQNQLNTNPYLYDNHVALIKTLRELGDLDLLRNARRKMSELFPLSEDLWLAWLQDEAGLVSDDTSRDQVTQLFEQAVKDYLSVPVWLEYAQFSIGGMAQAEGVKKIRETFDRALTACGLHVTKGGNLWEAFREFENAVLAGYLPAPGAVPTKEQEDKFSEQHDRVQALFKRQLGVPLQGLKETYQEYKEWLQDEPDKHIKQSYNKALCKLEKVQPYENKLTEAEAPRLAEYQEYIRHEEKDGDPARVQCVYERAIQENCLNSVIWLQYTKYLDHVLRIPSLEVYERSVRNCPWCVQLWQSYLLTLERSRHSHDKIKGVFETALLSGFSEGSEYLSLWTTYVDYLRRKIKWDQEHTEDVKVFRVSMEKAVEQLDGFGADGDPNGTLRQMWATIEAKFCKNMEKSRELWVEVMTAGRANEAALWMENYRFERQFGDNKHCRRVLQRALNSVTDWPESIVDAYINFERQEGNLEQYETAVSKCEAQMSRINERREKEAETKEFQQKKKFDKKVPAQKGKQKAFDKKPQQQFDKKQQKQFKQKQNTQEQVTDIKPYKRKNTNDAMETDTADTFRVPQSMPAKATPPVYKRGEPKSSAPPPGFKGEQPKSSAPPPGFKGEGGKSAPPPGYNNKREQEEENGTIDHDNTDGDGPPTKKHKTENDGASLPKNNPTTTAFISNLSYKVDEDKLRDFFKKCGEIEEIRLIKNFKGQSKGFAYVQFVDELAVSNALTYDRTAIEGRPMYVSKYEDRSSSKKDKADFKYSTNLEKSKLFIKNLPSTCTEEAVSNLFSQHGELKAVRLVTYKNGVSKGLAYVDFVDEQCAGQAVMKTDGLMVGDREISVSISNPPARKAPAFSREETSFTPTLGGGKKETQTRGVARTQVMLMPRSVTKAPLGGNRAPAKSAATSAAGGSGEDGAAGKTSSGMSNSDFRNMLLKK